MRSILAIYAVDREYGGPEEGGWFYDTGTFVRALAIHYDDASAMHAMRRAKRLLERLQRHRPPSSPTPTWTTMSRGPPSLAAPN